MAKKEEGSRTVGIFIAFRAFCRTMGSDRLEKEKLCMGMEEAEMLMTSHCARRQRKRWRATDRYISILEDSGEPVTAWIAKPHIR